MGLRKDVTILDDITVTGAYVKILSTVIDWEKQLVHFNLGCWKSRSASKAGKKQLPAVVLELVSPEITDPITGRTTPAKYENRFPVVTVSFSDASEPGTKANQYAMIKTVSFYADAADVSDN